MAAVLTPYSNRVTFAFVSFLLGVWLVETALFVLSYRTTGRNEGAPPANPL